MPLEDTATPYKQLSDESNETNKNKSLSIPWFWYVWELIHTGSLNFTFFALAGLMLAKVVPVLAIIGMYSPYLFAYLAALEVVDSIRDIYRLVKICQKEGATKKEIIMAILSALSSLSAMAGCAFAAIMGFGTISTLIPAALVGICAIAAPACFLAVFTIMLGTSIENLRTNWNSDKSVWENIAANVPTVTTIAVATLGLAAVTGGLFLSALGVSVAVLAPPILLGICAVALGFLLYQVYKNKPADAPAVESSKAQELEEKKVNSAGQQQDENSPLLEKNNNADVDNNQKVTPKTAEVNNPVAAAQSKQPDQTPSIANNRYTQFNSGHVQKHTSNNELTSSTDNELTKLSSSIDPNVPILN